MDTLDYILKKYDITLTENQYIVPIGWSRWRAMPRLFRELGFTKGAEIGVFKGSFTLYLTLFNPKLHLFGIDSWTKYDGYNDNITAELDENTFTEAQTRVSGRNVTLIKATSMEAVKQFEDESLDFVFIDANHDTEHVSEDIAAWSKKVRKGGLVCGHDYVKSARFPFGVIEAVDTWCDTNKIKPLFIWKDRCPSWMYVKM